VEVRFVGWYSPDMQSAGHSVSRPTYRLIQVLRAVAALMVVVHHSTIMLHDRNHLEIGYWLNGGAGVDIFFVISGFVMTVSSAPLRHTAHPARTFLKRRLERIVPMYWIMTAVKVLLLVAAPAMAVNALGSVWHVIASFLFLPSPNPDPMYDPVLVVGWTLNYEMLFYLLFAVVLAARGSLVKWLLPGLAILGLLHFVAPATLPGMVRWYLNPMVLEFGFGILLAMGLKHVKKIPPALALVVAMGCLTILCVWWQPNYSAWRCLLWGIPAAALVMSGLALEPTLGPRSPRWMLELGDASYSIYLVHGFVLPLVGLLLTWLGDGWMGVIPASMVCMVVLSTVSGEVAYRAIELPITRAFKGRRETPIPVNA